MAMPTELIGPRSIQSRAGSKTSSGHLEDKSKNHLKIDMETHLNISGGKHVATDPALAEELAKVELLGNKRGQEPKGCWNIMTGYVNSIWRVLLALDFIKQYIRNKMLLVINIVHFIFRSTTDMQNGEDLEVTVRTSTRELSIYCIFLMVLVIGRLRSLIKYIYYAYLCFSVNS